MNRNPSAAIVGAGLVHNLGGFAQLAAQREALTEASRPDTSELAALLPNVPLRRIPYYARMALLAALRALDDAGWRQDPEMRETALVIGTAYSGAQMNMDFMDSILDAGPRLSSPIAFSHAVNNMGSGLLSLLLCLQGPCLTVSQFELSFAGALSAATAMLYAGRARRVLVGAVDETDARFTRCCPQISKAGIPQSEGAVFLCLEKPSPMRPTLRVHWRARRSSSNAWDSDSPSSRHEHLYGYSPLAQALDTLLALNAVQQGKATRIDCPYAAAGSGREAIIAIRGPQPCKPGHYNG